MKTFLVQKNAGVAVPEDLWDKVLPDYSSATGMATLKSDGTFEVTRELSSLAPEDLNAILKDFKDQRVIFAFHNFPEGTAIDNVQPFDLVVDAKNNVKVVGFLAGDFSNYEQADSAYDPALHAAIENINPMLQKIYDDCKGDMKKFIAELKTEVRKKQLKAVGNDASVVLFASSGEIVAFTAQKEPTEWGWTSEIIGEESAEEETDTTDGEPEPKPDKPLSFAERLAASKKAKTGGDKPKDAKLPEGGSKTWDPAKFKTWRPNEKDNASQTKRREAFWRELGYLPRDWQDQSEPTTKRGWPKLKRPVATATLETLGIAGTISNNRDGTQTTGDTGTKHVPETPKPKPTSTPTKQQKPVEPRVLSEDVKNYIVDTFLANPDIRAAIDKGGKQIMSPEAIAKEEKESALFSEAIGMDIMDALAWRRSRLHELAEKAGLDAIVDLCNEFRLTLAKTLMAVEQHETLDTEAEEAGERDLDTSGTGVTDGEEEETPPNNSLAARLAASKKQQGVG